jgi:Ras-related protein Rab-18
MSNLRSHKVVLVGDSNVGKTSIVNSLFKKYKDGEPSTIGCAYHMYYSTKSNTNLGLWDTAGQERFRSIVKMYFRNVHAVIFVFDLSNTKSYDNLDKWIPHIDNIVKDEPYPPLRFLVGSKDDLIQGEVDMIKYIDYAEQNNMIFFSTSAKLRKNIFELFEKISMDLKLSKDHTLINDNNNNTNNTLQVFRNNDYYYNCCN